MRVDDFDFELPREFIADRPASPRDSARLLEVRPDGLTDYGVRDLPALLAPGDLLVFNDTRVIPARLAGQRGQARIEVTLHKLEAPERWRAFARPAKRLKPGDRIAFAADFAAKVVAKGAAGEVTLAFDRGGADLLAALERHGSMPLPPYMGRDADARDRADYQTLFAARDGAVAAPTAGLHFTPELVGALEARDIAHATVTLHVGAGTFLPVKVDDTRDHVMHSEWGEIAPDTAALIEATRAKGGRIVAVGTTSLRLLESAAGEGGTVRPFAGETDIFITPGYDFRAVDLLLTNFHLPRSTLLMLVSAFAGREQILRTYAVARQERYRFYSFGDAMLIL